MELFKEFVNELDESENLELISQLTRIEFMKTLGKPVKSFEIIESHGQIYVISFVPFGNQDPLIPIILNASKSIRAGLKLLTNHLIKFPIQTYCHEKWGNDALEIICTIKRLKMGLEDSETKYFHHWLDYCITIPLGK